MNGSALFLLLTIAGAEAATLSDLEAAFIEGRYDVVLEAAADRACTPCHVLAARALNAEAYFEPDRRAARRLAEEAAEFAEAAIETDPGIVEAELQAAIAMAMRGATMSPVKAFFTNLAGRARRHIDNALALDPENPWALSTSAAWRLEVSRRGGGGLYGEADPETGFEEFVRARAIAPENVAVAYEAALRLLASGRPEWRAPALAALEDAIAAAPLNAFEEKMQARANMLAAAVASGAESEQDFIDRQR